MAELEQIRWFLLERLVQHEEEEEAAVYPVVARLMGGEDPMGTMERAHMEIEHLARVFGHLLSDLPPEGPRLDDFADLRRVLYGLHAILEAAFRARGGSLRVARLRGRSTSGRPRRANPCNGSRFAQDASVDLEMDRGMLVRTRARPNGDGPTGD